MFLSRATATLAAAWLASCDGSSRDDPQPARSDVVYPDFGGTRPSALAPFEGKIDPSEFSQQPAAPDPALDADRSAALAKLENDPAVWKCVGQVRGKLPPDVYEIELTYVADGHVVALALRSRLFRNAPERDHFQRCLGRAAEGLALPARQSAATLRISTTLEPDSPALPAKLRSLGLDPDAIVPRGVPGGVPVIADPPTSVRPAHAANDADHDTTRGVSGGVPVIGAPPSLPRDPITRPCPPDMHASCRTVSWASLGIGPSVLRAPGLAPSVEIEVPLRLCFSIGGKPTRIEFVGAPPEPALAEIVLAEVKQWRLRPQPRRGVLTEVCAVHTVRRVAKSAR